MSFMPDSDRRTFLRATAVALTTGRFTMLRTWQQPLHPIETSATGNELAALGSATAWINSPPLTAMALKGKVVLVQFWTFTCINWLRTLPYIRAWAERYGSSGLVLIGVHTPEFAFEHDLTNVRRSVAELNVKHAVA